MVGGARFSRKDATLPLVMPRAGAPPPTTTRAATADERAPSAALAAARPRTSVDARRAGAAACAPRLTLPSVAALRGMPAAARSAGAAPAAAAATADVRPGAPDCAAAAAAAPARIDVTNDMGSIAPRAAREACSEEAAAAIKRGQGGGRAQNEAGWRVRNRDCETTLASKTLTDERRSP
jgi:hypothetical protein